MQKFIIYGILALALLLFLPLPIQAQTATPTPTPFPCPTDLIDCSTPTPTATPTATAIPTPTGQTMIEVATNSATSYGVYGMGQIIFNIGLILALYTGFMIGFKPFNL